MTSTPGVAFLCVLAAASCANVAERQRDDRRGLAELAGEHFGAALPAPGPGGGALAAEVRQLLATPLDEAAALKICVLNSHEMRAMLSELGVASADLVQAGLITNPVFTLNAKFFDAGAEIEGGLLQSFLDVFFLSARKRIAAAELARTQAHLARKLTALAFDVKRACVRVRAAERMLELERAHLVTARAAHDLMRDLHAAGNVTAPRFAAETVLLARAKLAAARADALRREAREPLNVLLGLWGEDVQWTLAGTLEDPPALTWPEDLEARAIRASYDLAENRALATATAQRAGLAAWEREFSSGAAGLAAEQEVDGEEWGLGPAIAFDLPLFDRGQASHAAAEVRLAGTLARHVHLAVAIRAAARRLRERELSLCEQAAFQRASELPAAAELVRTTLQDYNAMQIGVFEVLVARQQELDSAHEHARTLEAAWLARLDLQELLAGALADERSAAMPMALLEQAPTSSTPTTAPGVH